MECLIVCKTVRLHHLRINNVSSAQVEIWGAFLVNALLGKTGLEYRGGAVKVCSFATIRSISRL